jgi:plastocyanin
MRALALVFFMLMASPVVAADLTVSVRNSAGKPVSDAVVTVYPSSGLPAGAIHFDWPLVMAQQNLQFDPFVLIVPTGGVVTFPNRDQVRHHVYSFSPAHPFQLKLFGKDETRTVRFDKVGVVALGCNIHDQMVAFVKVVDTPYAAKTGPSGEVTLHGLPAGQVSIHVWHPYLKGAGDDVVHPSTLRPNGGREAITVDLKVIPERKSGSY